MTNKTAIAALIVGIVAFVVAVMPGTSTPQTQIMPATDTEAIVGSASSPAVGNDGCMTVNGQTSCYYHTALRQAASTTCSIKSPTATSTLRFGGANFSVGTSTGTFLIDIGKATTAYATSTKLAGTYTLAAGKKGAFAASTSPVSDGANIFAPNTYFNVKWGGDYAITSLTKPVGTCSAVFDII